jgi:hypothetical protein
MLPVNLGDQLQTAAVKAAGAAQTSSTNGSAVDLGAYEGEVALILAAQHGTGNADNTLNLKVQDSADGSTGWGDVSGATFTAVNGTTDSLQKLSINKNEIKRYIRYVSTIAGTTPSYIYSITLAAMKRYADGA